MAYRKNSNLHKLAYALEKRADFLEDAKNWIVDNPELAAGLLGGGLGAGAGALVPTEEGGGAGARVRNALIGALLGGGVGAGAGYLGKGKIKDLLGTSEESDYDKKEDEINAQLDEVNARNQAEIDRIDELKKDTARWLEGAMLRGEVDPNNVEAMRVANETGARIPSAEDIRNYKMNQSVTSNPKLIVNTPTVQPAQAEEVSNLDVSGAPDPNAPPEEVEDDPSLYAAEHPMYANLMRLLNPKPPAKGSILLKPKNNNSGSSVESLLSPDLLRLFQKNNPASIDELQNDADELQAMESLLQ